MICKISTFTVLEITTELLIKSFKLNCFKITLNMVISITFLRKNCFQKNSEKVGIILHFGKTLEGHA